MAMTFHKSEQFVTCSHCGHKHQPHQILKTAGVQQEEPGGRSFVPRLLRRDLLVEAVQRAPHALLRTATTNEKRVRRVRVKALREAHSHAKPQQLQHEGSQRQPDQATGARIAERGRPEFSGTRRIITNQTTDRQQTSRPSAARCSSSASDAATHSSAQSEYRHEDQTTREVAKRTDSRTGAQQSDNSACKAFGELGQVKQTSRRFSIETEACMPIDSDCRSRSHLTPAPFQTRARGTERPRPPPATADLCRREHD